MSITPDLGVLAKLERFVLSHWNSIGKDNGLHRNLGCGKHTTGGRAPAPSHVVLALLLFSVATFPDRNT